MPVNTRDKRASALHFPLPTPDVGAENQGDRQQVTWNYRGILASAPVVGAAGVFFRPLFRPRRR